MPPSVSITLKLPNGRSRPWSSCVYVGAVSGKYWFLQHGYVKYMYRIGRRTITKIWCSIRDALRDKKLWESIPREVRSVIVQIHGEPRFIESRRRIAVLHVGELVETLRFAQDVLTEVGTMLENVELCNRCRSKLLPTIVHIVEIFRKGWGIEPDPDETPQEYISKIISNAIERIDNTLRELETPGQQYT